ncbi:hypothetical protein [Adhaeribacter soli]|uniref:Uncharacterized protein n=1 Tax=Adhaeribacter soli TaxID=2607655 RepID=A0A5N1IRR5_9BACT|nr:hypothetical protein [Adhaeribacter soli]KAA9332700.1 hypothetical protein F0P94_11875 [Adhaeribacter soli]
MANKRFLRILFNVLVIVFGGLALWQFSFFRPYFGQPPAITHRISGNQTGPEDSVVAAPGLRYQRNAFARFWLGDHNRQRWATPVQVPVFRTGQPPHFFKILKRGGGMQTISFTLTDINGTAYALRSVDKNPVFALPPFARYTLVRSFVQDQISAADPYAFLVVAELARGAGIRQTQPQVVFVMPGDPAFQIFGIHKGGFFNLSQKYVEPSSLKQPNEKFTGFYTTLEMFHILDRDPAASVESAYYLKCRLFDLLISDWDRHAGQWDWLGFSGPKGTVFRPLPKDRDQALGYYEDGIIPALLTSKIGIRKFTSFTEEYNDVEGFTHNGRQLDERFLKHLKREQFIKTAKDLQLALTDMVLKNAVKQYPREVYPEAAPSIYRKLKARRDKLPEAALEFYKVYQD